MFRVLHFAILWRIQVLVPLEIGKVLVALFQVWVVMGDFDDVVWLQA